MNDANMPFNKDIQVFQLENKTKAIEMKPINSRIVLDKCAENRFCLIYPKYREVTNSFILEVIN